jgi:hypothetical protein
LGKTAGVLKGTFTGIEGPVAVKQYRFKTLTPYIVGIFYAEYRALSRLCNQPHIVLCHGCSLSYEQLHSLQQQAQESPETLSTEHKSLQLSLVLESVQWDLQELRDRMEPLPQGVLVSLALSLARAVQAVHAAVSRTMHVWSLYLAVYLILSIVIFHHFT